MVVARTVRAGAIVALAVALGGWTLERIRFGASDEAALSRIEAELRGRFETSAATLGTLAASISTQTDTILAASRDPAAAKRLFDAVDAALPPDSAGRTGISVYDRTAAPLAWAGRVWELPRVRIDGPTALFVAPGALGPRLVRVEPIADPARPPTRLATIVVEQSVGRGGTSPGLADTFTVSTALAPVALRALVEGSPVSSRPYTFAIRSQGGGLLVEAEVAPADLALARTRWRNITWAAIWSVLAITLLLAAAPLVERRSRTPDFRRCLTASVSLAVIIIIARIVFWLALAPLAAPPSALGPLDVILTNLTLLALVWLAIDLIERRRYSRPRPHLLRWSTKSGVVLAAAYAVAGFADIWLLWSYELRVQRIVSGTTIDLLHFSLHPLSLERLGLAFGLVLLHAAVIWAAAGIIRAPALFWRAPRGLALALGLPGWTVGAALALGARPAQLLPVVPLTPLLIALAAAGICVQALASWRARGRHASQAAQLGALFVALLIPAISTYPSLLAYATAAKEALIASEYGPQVMSQRNDLQVRMREALAAIDAMPALGDFVNGDQAGAPTTDRAFAVWARTDLAKYRLTSAIELYRADGSLLSRFALNLPEIATGQHVANSCADWDIFEEVTPFGSSERRTLRASRGICDTRRRLLGAIVVHAMLDYTALPFISSQSPYLESLRPQRQAADEGAPGRDVEFVVYGWSRAPIFAEGISTWTLPDDVFQRMVESRALFWATLERDRQRYRVYFLNDRGGIYALGYPVITSFGHVISLAELITLTFALFILILAAATLYNALTSQTPASGRALLREIRRSFYSKLFLAFLAGAVLPVVTLAILTRAYFVSQLNAGVQESAGRTAKVAQRLVEDYATLQQRGAGSGAANALRALDDQIMLLVRIAIDQDVNLFDRTQLVATSERELFASGLLSPRTPGDVYERIVLDRLPTYVGVEQVADFPYLLAAAPVRAGGGEGIVTVPIALHQQEIERQKDELDRRVLAGAVLFILLGGALGYWMAERIADPVNRLTRATRRIARGDLNARVAATSSDELRRLVEDFNQMAEDLQRQRTELERSQRLEAWADMARQVAHEIKNPLTPIQLSAEHARRINLDRGRPLSPVLDECINSILAQVKLLRQISAEFSSFASSPTPRPERTDLPALIEEVLEPYRAGLSGRITIDATAQADVPSVSIDRTLFARALTNVIENALHAMPGGGRLTIVSRTEMDPARLIVEVTDTGVGMDPESISRIFEPYFSTKATGTGLGLTIAKRNIELNGGTIHVTSERGVGTTVRLTVPIGQDLRI